MRTMRWGIVAALLALACAGTPARAAIMRLDAWRGHVAIGFGAIVSDSLAPGGSLSAAAGIDYPMGAKWRVGPTLSFDLLGSSNVTRGSIQAGLDYSLFEAAMLFTYLPSRGPVTRWSFGPGVASPRADLVVSAGGAGFSDLAVGEVKPELALDATLMPRRMTTVGVGIELGTRFVPASRVAWTLFTGRVAIHY